MVNVPPTKRQSIAVPGAPDQPGLDPGRRPKSAHDGAAGVGSLDDCRDWRVESCRRNVAELLARKVLDIATATA